MKGKGRKRRQRFAHWASSDLRKPSGRNDVFFFFPSPSPSISFYHYLGVRFPSFLSYYVQVTGTCHLETSVEHNSNSDLLKCAENLLTEQCMLRKTSAFVLVRFSSFLSCHVQAESSCAPKTSVEYNSKYDLLESSENLLTTGCKMKRNASYESVVSGNAVWAEGMCCLVQVTIHKVHSPSFQTFIRRDGGRFREWVCVCERDRGSGGGGGGGGWEGVQYLLLVKLKSEETAVEWTLENFLHLRAGPGDH